MAYPTPIAYTTCARPVNHDTSEPHHTNARRSLLNPHPRDDRHARHAAHASRHRHVATEAHATDRKTPATSGNESHDTASNKHRHTPTTTTHTNKETPAAAPTRHSHRGIPTPHTQPTPPRPATTPPGGARSLATRNALTTAQPQVKGNHHEHTPTRECAHPDDAESRPNMAETRKR